MEQLLQAFPGPLPLEAMYGKLAFYLVALVVGIAFGYSLEIGGFGKSTKLAAQFYFTDMTVFKVMFMGIIVAMVLVFGASALGWLDYNRVFVNPTYLWPGMVGGLIMGVGFVIGGFCPGTSLVALATLKKDGIAFVAGLTVGIFTFGENIDALFSDFWNSSNYGRFTLGDLFGVPLGVLVFSIVVMALLLFWLVEYVEDQVNGQKERFKNRKQKLSGAAILIFVAALVMIKGQPTVEQKWEWMAETEQSRIDSREVQIAPAEMLEFIDNDLVRTVLIDVRNESDFNLFHIIDAQHVSLTEIGAKAEKEYLHTPVNTLFIVMSNDEQSATEAWKLMRAQSIENVYILEHGINGWLDTFNDLVIESDPLAGNTPVPMDDRLAQEDEVLHYSFEAALGSNYAVADPVIHDHEFEFIPKVKMKVKKASGGG
ncbi:MAG: YeeE/YedE family protein [Candidatus Marinimicrobia bacterium]|nr:YeeE/YedE family protein [Candidatus Neomarinimicrobiota bacterium]